MARRKRSGGNGVAEARRVAAELFEKARTSPAAEAPPGCETGPVVAEKSGPPPLFRLTAAATDGVSPNIPVRWCLSRDAITQLREQGAQDPYLLVIIAREDEGAELGHRFTDVKRLLIPLDRGMERIVFPSAGKHRVFAAVVWSTKKAGAERWDDLHKLFLGKGMIGYVREVVTGESCCLNRWGYNHSGLNVYLLDHIAEIRVTVDERFFAKEPPAWLSWYVNLWCDGKPRDECHFRNRALWAFGIKWFPMLIWCLFAGVVRTVWAALLLLMGRRGVDPRPIWHSFAWSIEDVHEGTEEERKLRDPAHYWTLTTKDGKRRDALFFAVTPLLWCIYAGMAWWMRRRYGDMFTLDAWAVQYVAYMAIVVCCWIAIVAAGDTVFSFVSETIEEKAIRNIANASREELTRKAAEKDRQRAALERFYALRLDPLACPEGRETFALPGARPKVTVDALPPSHRTLHLRFQDLKARVCKPFAQ